MCWSSGGLRLLLCEKMQREAEDTREKEINGTCHFFDLFFSLGISSTSLYSSAARLFNPPPQGLSCWQTEFSFLMRTLNQLGAGRGENVSLKR